MSGDTTCTSQKCLLAAINPTALYLPTSIYSFPLIVSVTGQLKVTNAQYAEPDGLPHVPITYNLVSTTL